jgi:aminoglycoside 6'-N-acetyltransferase
MPHLTLRPATEAVIPLLEAWDEEPLVAASDPDDDWGWEQTLKAVGFETLIAEADGHPIGVVQLTDLLREASQYWGPPQAGLMAIDLWIGEPSARGEGLGRAMMSLALARCFADPSIKAVLIDPLATNQDAIGFYQRVGFTFVENRTFGTEICAVHQITRAQWRETFHPIP